MNIVGKKCVAWIVCICLVLSVFPFSASASEGSDMPVCSQIRGNFLCSVSRDSAFTDVQESDWFFDDVTYAYENDIMVGMSETLFEPQTGLNRAMLVTILHRLEGEPAAGTVEFTDVPAGSWYESAVAWANENGIISGYGNGIFEPDRKITREESVIILYRFAMYKSMDIGAQEAFDSFQDGHRTSQWAVDAMRWATGLKLIVGRGQNCLAPTDKITRAETAALLHRFMKLLNNGAAEVYYTVSFASKDEGTIDLPSVQKVLAGEHIVMPNPPTRSGYTFAAWVSETGEVFTEDDRVFTDLTLYASWKQETGSGSTLFANDASHIQIDRENNVCFYDNVINVFVLRGLNEDEQRELASTVDGVVVGQLSGAISYLQILVDASDYETICAKATMLEESPLVRYACHDLPWTAQASTQWNGDADLGNEAEPSGADWWAEAISAYSAWEYSEYAEPVRVGVLDSGFDWSHSDLQGKLHSIDEHGGNDAFALNTASKHGTAIAGTIAARNDREGVRGVADNAELICVDWSPITNDDTSPNFISLLNTGHFLEITDQMIRVCGVKVMNNSWGAFPVSEWVYQNTPEKMDALNQQLASQGVPYSDYLQIYRNNTILYTDICILLLYELIEDGYEDFLIVQSAGNGYDNGTEGYDLEKYGSFYCGMTQERFDALKARGGRNFSEDITFEMLKDHVLVVGATTNQYRSYHYGEDSYTLYEASYFSNYGDLVDLFAPGGSDKTASGGIFTTTFPCEENDYASYEWTCGTSLAAPIATGVAAFVWGLNPELSAKEVKQILTGNQTTWASGVVGEDAGRKYPMLNVADAVQKVMQSRDGLVRGKVCTALDRMTPVENASIVLYCETVQCAQSFTQADGSYDLRVPSGSYRVQISADGYIPFEAYLEVNPDEVCYTETYLMVQGDTQTIGTASGRIVHALLGSSLSGVTIEVRQGWNNTAIGAVIATTVSDSQGHYSVELPLGNYTLTLCKDGFVSNHVNIVVQEGLTDEQNGTLTPVSSDNEFRIVLTWDKDPRDLDSHVYGTKQDGSFHTYFNNKQSYDRGNLICALDVDDTDSYGPETITLKADKSGIYYFYVHRYAGDGSIATSRAKVCVYQGDCLIAEYNVPTDQGSADYWNVFVIANGKLYSKNSITDSPDLDFTGRDG